MKPKINQREYWANDSVQVGPSCVSSSSDLLVLAGGILPERLGQYLRPKPVKKKDLPAALKKTGTLIYLTQLLGYRR